MDAPDAMLMPPASIESEQSVLGGLFMDPSAYDRISWLSGQAFFRGDHKLIFAAQTALIEAGRGCDLLLVIEHLKARGELESAGGVSYMGTLQFNTPSAANIHRYAEIVMNRWGLRRLLTEASNVGGKAHEPGADPKAIADQACEAFLSVAQAREVGEPQPFYRALADAIDWMDEPIKGIPTGYPALDNVLDGLRPGELIIVAGRPSMGKTALAYCIAEHVARSVPTVFFSLEMTGRQIGVRAMKYHESLTDRTTAYNHLSALKLHVDESSQMTVGSMRLRLQRLRRTSGVGLVVVDYLQLMRGEGENRTQEVGSLSRGLKSIAKEFNVPVIAVSQINRGVEQRGDKRPLMSDLRESGDIEQDADVVAFVYRDEYYDLNSPAKGLAEVLIRKHRNGATGTAWLGFRPQHARFVNHDGPLPRMNEPKSKVANFNDYKTAAGGE